MNINNVTIIGAGTMGNGIAQVFAMQKYNVVLCDINEMALLKGMKSIQTNLDRMVKKDVISDSIKQFTLDHISSSVDIEKGISQADLIVEAATENIDLKLKIFKMMDQSAHKNCILATNTSSISITKIASVTSRPDKVIGMHFMNPVPVMKLVEVIRGYETSDAVCSIIMELSVLLKKEPVEVHDFPGFIANRILMPMINESIWALHEGVAGIYEIDTVMKLGMAHPMGPLALADFIGLDVCMSILQIMYQGFGNPKYSPCPLLVNMVNAGKLGKKSGEGFYMYTEGSKDMKISPKFV